MRLEAGAGYVVDKGYCDYTWWHRIDAAQARFVTRFKRNAARKVERELPIAPEDAGVVLRDEIVCFANRHPRGGRTHHYQKPLRRVVGARPEHDQPLVLATHALASPAARIARRYKERWGIELFFKWITQPLKIKRFPGRTENAVRIQILTALIAYLPLALYAKVRTRPGSLWMWLAEVRATLFARPGIEAVLYRRRNDAASELASRQRGLFA